MSHLYYYHLLTGNKNKQVHYLLKNDSFNQVKPLLDKIKNKENFDIFKIIDEKIKSNNISCLLFIKDNIEIKLNASLSFHISYQASKLGNFKIFKIFCRHCKDSNESENLLKLAAASQYVHISKWAQGIEAFEKITKKIFYDKRQLEYDFFSACLANNLEHVIKLHSQGVNIHVDSERGLYTSIHNGCIDVQDYLADFCDDDYFKKLYPNVFIKKKVEDFYFNLKSQLKDKHTEKKVKI